MEIYWRNGLKKQWIKVWTSKGLISRHWKKGLYVHYLEIHTSYTYFLLLLFYLLRCHNIITDTLQPFRRNPPWTEINSSTNMKLKELFLTFVFLNGWRGRIEVEWRLEYDQRGIIVLVSSHPFHIFNATPRSSSSS